MSAPHPTPSPLTAELDWLSRVIHARFEAYFQPDANTEDIYSLPLPNPGGEGEYTNLLNDLAQRASFDKDEDRWLSTAGRLLILLALAPHVKPELLDLFFTNNTLYNRGFTEFGGVSSKQHGGFLPTGETAMFLLAGGDLGKRRRLLEFFTEDHFLATENIIRLSGQQPNEPFLSGVLTLGEEYLARLTTGQPHEPRYGNQFPARRLTTKMTWEDLVLPPNLLNNLGEISTWIDHEATIMGDFGLDKFIKPGYRALFYGPPGTGKTLCATLLGQKAGRPVYRVDLSQVVSKYIGETEKNLAGLFARAEHKDWILFFDEADALFGKRTSTKGGNDRYANQEVAYLLQRIESYDGVVILASNLKGNIDEAFARRFQAMLYFPIPDARQRLRLWQNIFGEQLPLADDIDFNVLAQKYELAGGAIVNIVRYCALAVLQRGERVVQHRDVLEGVRRELRKGGKTG